MRRTCRRRSGSGERGARQGHIILQISQHPMISASISRQVARWQRQAVGQNFSLANARGAGRGGGARPGKSQRRPRRIGEAVGCRPARRSDCPRPAPILHRIEHRAIGEWTIPPGQNSGGEIGMAAATNGRLEQRIQRVAMGEAARRRRRHRAPPRLAAIASPRPSAVIRLAHARRHDDDHRPLAVGGDEIAPEQAIDRIAQPRPVRPVIKHFGYPAEIGDGADRDIGQRNPHLAPFARRAPALDRGEQRKGSVSAAEQIPGRQHMVDRIGTGAGQ